MSAASEADKLSQVVLVSLEEETNADELARRAYRSRAQFFRVFGALIEETPAAMRRRLLLERAGWQLGRTGMARDGDRLRRPLRIARGVHAGVQPRVQDLAEPVSADGRDPLPPAGAERDPFLRASSRVGRREHGSV